LLTCGDKYCRGKKLCRGKKFCRVIVEATSRGKKLVGSLLKPLLKRVTLVVA
jgi:hypothetical protein